MFVSVKVLNWKKYQGDHRKGKCWWFKNGNDFFTSQDLEDLDDKDLLVWLFILCECSKQNTDSPVIKISYFEKHSRIKKDQLFKSLNKLCKVSTVPALCEYSESTVLAQTEENKILEENKIAERHRSARLDLASLSVDTFLELTDKKVLDSWNLKLGEAKILTEFSSMIDWLISNPHKNKTRGGVTRFVNSWLTKTHRALQQKEKKVPTVPDLGGVKRDA